MDIFDFAIQMETEGQEYYMELASQTNQTGLKNILKMLAEDEIKHQMAIEKVRISSCIMADTSVLDDAKNVFRQMKDFDGDFSLSGDEEHLYRQAMELEEKSRSFYMDKADQVTTSQQKALFKKIAAEEEKHYHLLSNLVDFVGAPKNWLADAEFERIDEN